MQHPTVYRTIQIDGLSIFYREAGPKNAPTILLLHGLPSSSRMFEPLLDRLSDRFHLVAPDYPGFGHSDWPDPNQFTYTFDHIAEVMNHFTEALGLSHFSLYMQDYGGPVGFRMTLPTECGHPHGAFNKSTWLRPCVRERPCSLGTPQRGGSRSRIARTRSS